MMHLSDNNIGLHDISIRDHHQSQCNPKPKSVNWHSMAPRRLPQELHRRKYGIRFKGQRFYSMAYVAQLSTDQSLGATRVRVHDQNSIYSSASKFINFMSENFFCI